MPVLRLAETACVVSRRSPLHRPTQLAAANRPSLRRNPISPAVVVFRPRSLGYDCQAQGAGGEFRSKADRLCRSAQYRIGIRAHARERGRLASRIAHSRWAPQPPGPIEQTSEEEWRASIDGNLTATFLTIKSFLPRMKERRTGSIITMSSAAARRPYPMSPIAYAAAKAGIEI